MQSCDTLPPERVQDILVHNECLEVLTRDYKYEQVLGSGMKGVVLAIQPRPNLLSPPLAVKLMPIDNAVGEIQAACKINELFYKSPIFTQTTGWIVCDQIPKLWLYNNAHARQLREWLQRDKKIAYLVSVRNEFRFYENDMDTDLLLLKAGLFLLLHGIGTARRFFGGFSHGDIHQGNLMWSTNPSPDKRITVSMDTFEFRVEAPYILKLIDFQHATFGKAEETYDLHHLMDVFTYYSHFGNSPEFSEAKSWDSATFSAKLLLHPFFNNVRRVYNLDEMDRNQKRLKIMEDPSGYAYFVDEDTGRILTEDELVTFYTKALERVILRDKTNAKRLLGLLERTSKKLKNFVAQYFMWYKLFKRDFPLQHELAVVAARGRDPEPPYLMHQNIKNKLDEYSKNPGRPATYWKRYYELLSRSNLKFDRKLSDRTMPDPFNGESNVIVHRGTSAGADVFYITKISKEAAKREHQSLKVEISSGGGGAVGEIVITKTVVTSDTIYEYWTLDAKDGFVSWRTRTGFEKIVVTRSTFGFATLQIQLYALYDNMQQQSGKRQLVSSKFYQ